MKNKAIAGVVTIELILGCICVYALATRCWPEEEKPVFEEPLPQWTNLDDHQREINIRKLEEGK